MRHQAGGARGGLVLVGSRIAIFAATAGSSLVVARVLGPDQYGIVAAAAAIAGILLLFGGFGVDQLYLTGAISLDALRSRTTQIALASIGLAGAGALVWPGIGWQGRVCVALIGAAVALDSLRLPYLLEPQRRLDFGRRARRETMLRLSAGAASVATVLAWRSPVAMAAGMLVASAVLLVPARGRPRFDRVLPWRSLPGALRLGLPFALSGALYTLYFQIDMALLASLRQPAEVAEYRVAYSFVTAAVVLAVAWNNEVMRPRLYREEPGSPRFHAILRSGGWTSVLGGLACGGAMVVFGPAVVRLAYGTVYEASGSLVRTLGVAVVAHFFNSWAGNVLVAQRRLRTVVRLQSVLVAANVLGNVLLIPKYGTGGAAAMTVATEWAGVLIYGMTLWRTGSTRETADRD